MISLCFEEDWHSDAVTPTLLSLHSFAEISDQMLASYVFLPGSKERLILQPRQTLIFVLWTKLST